MVSQKSIFKQLLRANPKKLISKMGIKEFLLKSHFMSQLREAVKAGQITPVHPLHFIMNMMGLTVFPFVGSPLFQNLGDLNQAEFIALMQERKKLVPAWMKAMLKEK